jgi:flagellar hook-associated protein 3 FlgL
MTIVSIGDLAQNLQLRRDTARVNSDLNRLANELSSGLKSDIGAAVGGDFRALAGIERSLTSLDAYGVAAKEASVATEVSQNVLQRIGDDSAVLANSLLLVQNLPDSQLLDTSAQDARSQFASAVAGLNSSVAGRSLFAGQDFEGPSLADAETILGDLLTAVGTPADANDVLTAVDAWFAPGGPFETNAYQGSVAPAAPVRVADGVDVTALRQAIDPGVVGTLKELATAALIDLGVLAGNPNERIVLGRTVGERLLSANDDLIDLRSEIGVVQERISRAQAQNSAEQSSYELVRSDLVSADPYETATRLQSVESQLRTLYTVTGRLSDLSLTSYLR